MECPSPLLPLARRDRTRSTAAEAAHPAALARSAGLPGPVPNQYCSCECRDNIPQDCRSDTNIAVAQRQHLGAAPRNRARTQQLGVRRGKPKGMTTDRTMPATKAGRTKTDRRIQSQMTDQ